MNKDVQQDRGRAGPEPRPYFQIRQCALSAITLNFFKLSFKQR